MHFQFQQQRPNCLPKSFFQPGHPESVREGTCLSISRQKFLFLSDFPKYNFPKLNMTLKSFYKYGMHMGQKFAHLIN